MGFFQGWGSNPTRPKRFGLRADHRNGCRSELRISRTSSTQNDEGSGTNRQVTIISFHSKNSKLKCYSANQLLVSENVRSKTLVFFIKVSVM